MLKTPRFSLLLIGTALLAGGLALYRQTAVRDHFDGLMRIWWLAGLGYAVLLWAAWRLPSASVRWPLVLISLGMALRLLLLGDPPALSDDAYRFLWDGHLWNHGVHPFAYTPRVALAQLGVPGLTPAWLALLNSPDYYTVYPPLGQYAFRVAAYWANGDLAKGVLALQVLLWLGEGATLLLLYRFLKKQAPQRVNFGLALYAFHPLAIIETVGNVHFEGMMMGCVVGGWLLLMGQHRFAAGLAWAAGIAVKLLPLMWAPLVLAWLGKKRFWPFVSGAALGTLVLFAPLADWEVLRNMQSSIHLYFQQFEFNASVYYLLSHASPYFTGWYEGRSISPFLALVTISAIGWCSWRLWAKKQHGLLPLQQAMLLCGTVYLFNATTVHPWYVLVPLVASIGTGWYFPAVWGATAFFSYSHYIGGGRQEHFGWIALEYAAVAAMLWYEWYRQRHQSRATTPA